jgi:hypothetical protein
MLNRALILFLILVESELGDLLRIDDRQVARLQVSVLPDSFCERLRSPE